MMAKRRRNVTIVRHPATRKATLVIELKIDADGAHDVADMVDRLLDNGDIQDLIEERCADQDVDVTIYDAQVLVEK